MDSLRAHCLPAHGYFQRVVVIHRFPGVVTLKKTDTFAVAQVYGWNNIYGFYLPLWYFSDCYYNII